jgi:hypothetical protein
MVRSIDALLLIGSLPAILQVKGCFDTLQESHVQAASPQVFQDSR